MATAANLLLELASFTTVTETLLEKVRGKNITEENNSKFRSLLGDYMDGAYDEDPDLLVQEISYL